MSQNQQDVLEVVDEFVDNLDPSRLESEADRLGLTVEALIDRIAVEAKARCAE